MFPIILEIRNTELMRNLPFFSRTIPNFAAANHSLLNPSMRISLSNFS